MPPAPGSIGIFIDKAFEKCQKQNFEIKSQSPVFNVIQIAFNPFDYGGVPPVTVDLRPAGHAGAHLVLDHVARDLLLKLLHKKRPLGPRPHEAHVALQHVPELRQLVEAVFAHDVADGRDARVVERDFLTPPNSVS